MALIDEQHREARAQSLVSMPALRAKELGQDARKGEAGPKVGFGALAARQCGRKLRFGQTGGPSSTLPFFSCSK